MHKSIKKPIKVAGEPISRILCAALAPSVTIIPLGLESLRGSSSLPEGRGSGPLRACCVRAGPALPSYLALLHAGFAVPRMLPSGRWGLTPPFHPRQMSRPKQAGHWFPVDLPPRCEHHRRFHFLWHCPWPRDRFATKAQPPGVTRRVALNPADFEGRREWSDALAS